SSLQPVSALGTQRACVFRQPCESNGSCRRRRDRRTHAAGQPRQRNDRWAERFRRRIREPDSKGQCSVIVRDLVASDEARLRELHAESGIGYEFPALESPLFIVKRVIADENGRPVIAATAKIIAETAILCDQNYLTPALRLKALEVLHEDMRQQLQAKGIDEVVAFVPPEKKSFVRRMIKYFGWAKPNYECYARSV